MKPNTSPRVRSLASRAFTMLELVVVLALLVLMAGVLAPIVLQSKKEAQAAKILGVTDALRQACERFYADNGRYPTDTTGTAPTALHELSENDSSLPNWKGPYLLAPLNKADNPAHAAIKVLNTLSSAAISPPFTSASGSGGATAVFFAVDEEVARLVNDSIDGDEGENWNSLGLVTYQPGSSGTSAVGTKSILPKGVSGSASGSSGAIEGGSGSGTFEGGGSGGGSGSGGEEDRDESSGGGGSGGIGAGASGGITSTSPVPKAVTTTISKLNIAVSVKP